MAFTDIPSALEAKFLASARESRIVTLAGIKAIHRILENSRAARAAQEFRSLMDLSVVSCFLTAKFALPHLRKTKGNIIDIASLVNVIGQKYAVPYVATKGAVTAMIKAMAIDESKYSVRVNSISPGNIWTPMWEKLASHTANPEATIQEGKDAQLLGRMGTPAECAAAVLYLASDATFCTGINLVLSGGAELGYAQKSHRNSSSDFEG
ncbi:17-beta-hydroxysteroid dehydrogenase 14-like [Rhineura floridana]|uniref:17-beta-hydroxysteroid dehydrogenase 14-like n=1 Tax=Rhineura floridana TaxID=261503 RepID=UPI002AC863C6|nr:17-beta-hydroxysteroid dehydrogenase 14-like [Rhineura floridana]